MAVVRIWIQSAFIIAGKRAVYVIRKPHTAADFVLITSAKHAAPVGMVI
jgi:hypothetical protein